MPTDRILSVSNSLSGRHWELDQVPAVGDLTDIVQLGTGHHVSAGEGQRRVALQRRVAAYLVGGGQTPRNVASILDSARELGIRDAQDPHRPMRYDTGRPRAVIRLRISQPRTASLLSVSNSLSGRHWELDQVPAVGDLTDIVQLGTGHHVSAGEGQRRVAFQRRVAAYLVGGGQTPGATQRCLKPGCSERIGNSRRTGSSPADVIRH